jgi:hypothetical protein
MPTPAAMQFATGSAKIRSERRLLFLHRNTVQPAKNLFTNRGAIRAVDTLHQDEFRQPGRRILFYQPLLLRF